MPPGEGGVTVIVGKTVRTRLRCFPFSADCPHTTELPLQLVTGSERVMKPMQTLFYSGAARGQAKALPAAANLGGCSLDLRQHTV